MWAAQKEPQRLSAKIAVSYMCVAYCLKSEHEKAG